MVLGALVVLTPALRELQFRPGQTFHSPSSAPAPGLVSALQLAAEIPLWKLLLFWLACVVNLVLFFYLLPPELRKKILRQISGIATGLLILLLALRYRVLTLPEMAPGPGNSPGQVKAGLQLSADVPSFHPPQVTSWTAFLVAAVSFLALLVLFALLYRKWRLAQLSTGMPLGAIADIAQASLRELLAGRDLGDVIFQSYVKMIEAVRSRRGLARKSWATAREFAAELTQAGLPANAVATLTRLFEAARYGARGSTDSERQEAVDSLNDILLACGTNP